MVVGKDGERLTVRVPKGMAEQLADAARAQGRSRNSEVVVRLHASLAKEQKKRK